MLKSIVFHYTSKFFALNFDYSMLKSQLIFGIDYLRLKIRHWPPGPPVPSLLFKKITDVKTYFITYYRIPRHCGSRKKLSCSINKVWHNQTKTHILETMKKCYFPLWSIFSQMHKGGDGGGQWDLTGPPWKCSKTF